MGWRKLIISHAGRLHMRANYRELRPWLLVLDVLAERPSEYKSVICTLTTHPYNMSVSDIRHLMGNMRQGRLIRRDARRGGYVATSKGRKLLHALRSFLLVVMEISELENDSQLDAWRLIADHAKWSGIRMACIVYADADDE